MNPSLRNSTSSDELSLISVLSFGYRQNPNYLEPIEVPHLFIYRKNPFEQLNNLKEEHAKSQTYYAKFKKALPSAIYLTALTIDVVQLAFFGIKSIKSKNPFILMISLFAHTAFTCISSIKKDEYVKSKSKSKIKKIASFIISPLDLPYYMIKDMITSQRKYDKDVNQKISDLTKEIKATSDYLTKNKEKITTHAKTYKERTEVNVIPPNKKKRTKLQDSKFDILSYKESDTLLANRITGGRLNNFISEAKKVDQLTYTESDYIEDSTEELIEKLKDFVIF